MEDTNLETCETSGSGYNLLLVGSLTLHYDALRQYCSASLAVSADLIILIITASLSHR